MWHYKIKNNTTIIFPNKYALKIILSLLFILSTLFTSLSLSSVNVSAKTSSQMNIGEQSMAYIYYQSLTMCSDWKLSKTDFGANKLELPDAYNFNWFANNPVASTKPVSEILEKNGYLVPDKELNLICGDNNSIPWIRDAITNPNYWGYNNGLDAVCEFGLKRIRDGSTEVDCKSGKDSAGNVDAAKDKLQNPSFKMDASVMKKTLTDRMGGNINLTNPIKYKLYLNAFEKSCAGGGVATADGDNTYTIKAVDVATGNVSEKIFAAAKPPSQNVAFYLTMEKSIDDIADRTKTTCKEIASTLNDSALANTFASQLKANLGNPEITPETPGLGTPTGGGGATDSDATCGSTVKIVGWIMCPVVNGLVLLNDGMWNIASFLLTTKPLNQSDSIFKAWSAIRNIANVAFAIAFLVIIFSQISSIGINNYGIKKLLPRLIVCAILVNLSFFIVQIMVDLANISGSSIYNIMQSLVKDSTTYNPEQHWQTLLKGILSAGAGWAGSLAVAAFIGPEILFWMLFPVLIMATLAFFAAIFTLIFRTAMIPILAVLSPLAFVAYLLPNTEQWFKKWKDMFIKMLMLYPLAALVFGGSRLAAVITMGDGDNVLNGFIGGIIMALPLFALPFLAKQGGDILSKVNGALMGLANKAKNPISNYAKGRQDHAESKYLANEPKPGSIFGSARRTGHRMYRNRAMRRKTRELETDTNKENFNSDWAEDPTKDEHGKPRTVTEEEARARRRMGNGYQAIQRSQTAKGRAENIKTAAETSYLDSNEGKEMQNRLTAIQTDNQRAKAATKLRTDMLNNDALEKNDNLKLTQDKMDQKRKIRVNQSQFGKAINRSITNNQLRINDLSKEAEEGSAGSVEGKALHDSINLRSENIKEHALASEQRVAASTEGQAVKKRIMGLQDDVKTAQNNATISYNQDPTTFKSRVLAKASEKTSTAATTKSNATIAEMGVMKLRDDKTPIPLVVGGVTQKDSNGNVLYEYANTPSGTGMTINELSEISGQILNSDKDIMMNNMKEKSAQGLSEFRTYGELSKSDTLANYASSVGGESKFGPTIKQATAAQIISDDTKKSVAALKANYANNGLANDEFIEMIESGYELKKDNSGNWVQDNTKPLSPEGHMAAFSSGFVSGHTPTQRKLFDAMMKVDNPNDRRYDTMTELRKAMAPEIFSAPNRYNFISKSVLNKLKNGETKREYRIPAQILKGVADGKPSPEFIAKVGADEMNDVAKTFVANPISSVEDFKGRLSMLNNIIAAREDPIIKQRMPPEAMVEQDFALDVLYGQLQAYKSRNISTLGAENITDPVSRSAINHTPPPDDGIGGKHSRTAETAFTI